MTNESVPTCAACGSKIIYSWTLGKRLPYCSSCFGKLEIKGRPYDGKEPKTRKRKAS